MATEVTVQGDGIAATCCAKLLERRGISYSFDPARAAGQHRPVLLINPQTQKLVSDVFEGSDFLPECAQPVRRRAVLWEKDVKWFPHAGFAVQESELLDRLWNSVQVSQPIGERAWTIHSSRMSADRAHCGFGNRIATNVKVALKDPENDACSMEAVADGWLFLLPAGSGLGSLIAVGAPPSDLLSESRLVGPQLTGLVGTTLQFAAAPRISMPLCDSGWLACGSAAMAFDPICGEGAGHAVREAILAVAVLGRIHEGASPPAMLAEYSARLLAGLARHLELSRQFYVSGRRGEWWDEQIQACERGLDWTRTQLNAGPTPSSRLVGFDLVAAPAQQ
jgi:hypothetical protein